MGRSDTRDRPLLYSRLAGDSDLGELVALFVDELPQRLVALIDALETRDCAQLGRLAHQLKGAVGSYGFEDLTPVVARLEQAARGGQPIDDVERCLRELVDLCQYVRS